MDARAHKRAACARIAECARAAATEAAQGNTRYADDNAARAAAAYTELAVEMERRGVVVHRAPDPSPDAPALPYPDQIERVERTPENG